MANTLLVPITFLFKPYIENTIAIIPTIPHKLINQDINPVIKPTKEKTSITLFELPITFSLTVLVLNPLHNVRKIYCYHFNLI